MPPHRTALPPPTTPLHDRIEPNRLLVGMLLLLLMLRSRCVCGDHKEINVFIVTSFIIRTMAADGGGQPGKMIAPNSPSQQIDFHYYICEMHAAKCARKGSDGGGAGKRCWHFLRVYWCWCWCGCGNRKITHTHTQRPKSRAVVCQKNARTRAHSNAKLVREHERPSQQRRQTQNRRADNVVPRRVVLATPPPPPPSRLSNARRAMRPQIGAKKCCEEICRCLCAACMHTHYY